MIINKKEINKLDWKNFIKWTDEGKFLLSNSNFFSNLFSINKDYELEESLVEFSIYNHHILGDRYALEIPDWLRSNMKDSIEETIKSLMEEFLKEKAWKIFQEFYIKLIYYLVDSTKDVDTEYNLAMEYNNFIDELKKETRDYNRYIVYLNKNIHIDLKGFKR